MYHQTPRNNFSRVLPLFILGIMAVVNCSFGTEYLIDSIYNNRCIIRWRISPLSLREETSGPFFLGVIAAPSNPPEVQFRQESPSSPDVRIIRKKRCQTRYGYCYWTVFSVDKLNNTLDNSGKVTISFPNSRTELDKKECSIRHGILFSGIDPQNSTALPKQQAREPLGRKPYEHVLRIEVVHDGLYELSKEMLYEAGVPVEHISSEHYRLFCDGREVPIYITNSYRDHLGNNDKILFYGERLYEKGSSLPPYSNTNVYWLCWDGTRPGLRVREATGELRIDTRKYSEKNIQIEAQPFRDTLHFEYDNRIRWLGDIHQPQNMTTPEDTSNNVDRWYWGIVGENEITRFSIQLPAPYSADQATIRANLMGLSSIDEQNPDHTLQLLINDNSPGQNSIFSWDGTDTIIHNTPAFSASQLRTGKNTITFRTEPSSYPDRSALNWLEIAYTRSFRAFDNTLLFRRSSRDTGGITQFTIDGFSSPHIDLWDIDNNRVFSYFTTSRRTQNDTSGYSLIFQDSIQGSPHYYAGTRHKRRKPHAVSKDTLFHGWDAFNDADYIMVTSSKLRAALHPLAEYHRQKGMKVALISMDDVYNSFTNGIHDPDALLHMVRYLYYSGDRKPRYLLLGGDTSHDLDKNKSHSSLNVVPTHLSYVPGWGPSANDDYFACVDGNDNIPDLFVGRLPAQSREQMRELVTKTVSYLKAPSYGPWRHRLLLLGGAESAFADFNHIAQHDIIGSSMRTLRMDANPGSAHYYSTYAASRTLMDYVNTGVYAINFNGHGGGNVWSDNDFFRLEDISSLYNGQWGSGGRLPFIFSFTCLTGFFESISYKSLGEELLRHTNGGAIGFYGAAGYSSQQGNMLMNRFLLEHATKNDSISIGKLLWLTELKMLVYDAFKYLPQTRQYNFLGDPALEWNPPRDSISLSARIRPGKGSIDSCVVSAKLPGMSAAHAELCARSSAGEVFTTTVHTENDSIIFRFPLKKNAVIQDGNISLYAWNNTSHAYGCTSFSHNALNISDITIQPREPAAGESVYVSCRIDDHIDSALQEAVCLYAWGAPYGTISFENNAILPLHYNETAGIWHTTSSISVPSHYTETLTRLFVKIRTNGSNLRESAVYSFALRETGNLTFGAATPGLRWYKDSLSLHTQLLNNGTAPVYGFGVIARTTGTSTPLDTIVNYHTAHTLRPGESYRFDHSIYDIRGRHTFELLLVNPDSTNEMKRSDNFTRFTTRVSWKECTDGTDTLFCPDSSAFFISRTSCTPGSRLFLISHPAPALSPASSFRPHWLPLRGDDSVSYSGHIRNASGSDTSDSLHWTLLCDSASAHSALSKQITATGYKTGICLYDSIPEQWRYSPSQWYAKDYAVKSTVAEGYRIAAAVIYDCDAPHVDLTVAGYHVTQQGYAAKNAPFNLDISDPSGIPGSSISITLNNQPLQKSTLSELDLSQCRESFSVTAYPPAQHEYDSLRIHAADLAGNDTVVTYIYKPGKNLSISFLACHPNPFTARRTENTIREPIRLVYMITDDADRIDASIYTITGQVVRKWRYNSAEMTAPGYHEIVWDGTTQFGHRIANGTYYFVLEARNEEKKAKKILKIAKCEGYSLK